MAATRSPPVLEATESSSSSSSSSSSRDDDGTSSSMQDIAALDPSGPSVVDLLANLPDPLDTLDPSYCGIAQLRPPSPTQQAPEGHVNLMTASHHGQEGPVQQEKGGNDEGTPPQPNKGMAPETTPMLSGTEQPPGAKSHEANSDNLQQTRPLTGPALKTESPESSVGLPGSAANGEDSESSNRAALPEASCPSSPFEEARDHVAATAASALGDQVASPLKQKEKQKAEPEAETGACENEDAKTFHPLSLGDPGWEKSAGRPPQKLPVRFRDAVGRNYLFPWEKAKTWLGMKRLIQSCFIHVEVIGPHVMAGRYDLSVTLPFPMDTVNETPQVSTSTAETPSSSTTADSPPPAPDPSASTNSSQQQRSSFVVLPELWEDTIEPGMLVVQHMWPFQTPNFNIQPSQPSPPNHHHHPHHPAAAGRGRGVRGRGRGASANMFGGRGGVSGNIFAPPPPPGGSRPPMIVIVNPGRRGKTMKRQEGTR
ncbi:hypothetical protein HD806DRAFT_489640 [Xylariaceae sp. AK1471]|nr:hypothetical protein HD806DRAFT_489640 [Xylariaceae sp. AK1471]